MLLVHFMFVMSIGRLLEGLMHTEVCIGLDIAHFPSLMYGFIMQQIYVYEHMMNKYIVHLQQYITILYIYNKVKI